MNNNEIIKKLQRKNGQLWEDRLSEIFSSMTCWMSYLRGIEEFSSRNCCSERVALEALEIITEKLFQLSIVVEEMGYEPSSISSEKEVLSISSFFSGRLVPEKPIPIWLFNIVGEHIHFFDERWDCFLTEEGWEVEIDWE